MIRNPLGIIGLFISLIYGFACLVLSTSISNLNTEQERLPLIWFIIAFPIIILIAFIFLVVKHHEKLYSPSDFRADDAFIQTIDNRKIKQKALEEVETLEKADNKTEIHDMNSLTDDKEKTSSERGKNNPTIDYNLSTQLSKEDLLKKVTNSEKWVLQQLSLQYNILFKGNLRLSTQNGTFDFDGMGSLGNRTYVVETKFWQAKKSINQLKFSIQEYVEKTKKIESVYSKRNQEFFMIIAIVFDNLETVDTKPIFEFIKQLYSNTIIEFYDYNKLKDDFQ